MAICHPLKKSWGLRQDEDGVDDNSVLQIVIVKPIPNAPVDIDVVDKITLDLNIEHGMIPLRFKREFAIRDGQTCDANMPHYFVAVWAGIKDFGAGLLLPTQLRITESDSIAFALGPDGFQPLLENGAPVVRNGVPKIDYSKTKVELYDVSVYSLDATELVVNRPLPAPLCCVEFSEGTVVQDDATNEVFQLTATGSPFDKAVLGAIAKSAAQNGKSIPWSRNLKWLIFVNVVLVIVLGAFLYRRSSSSRRQNR